MAADKKRKRNEEREAAKASGIPDSIADHDNDPTTIHDLSSHEADDAGATAADSTEADNAHAESAATETAVPESSGAHAATADEVTDAAASVDPQPDAAPAEGTFDLSDEDAALLDRAAADIVAEMRSDMLRAQAELVNFRTRVERDRAANRESVIAEVIRALLPTIDDLSRAEQHGDLEGSPLELVATKLRATFDRYGVREVGVKGEPFDPNYHEAVVQLPTAGATSNTVADVIETGYALGERLLRAAKVAVSVPE